jgi:hypothetical protein
MYSKEQLKELKLASNEIDAILNNPDEVVDIQSFLLHLKYKAQVKKIKFFKGYDLETPKNTLTANIINESQADFLAIMSRWNVVRTILSKSWLQYSKSILKRPAELKQPLENIKGHIKEKIIELYAKFFNTEEVLLFLKENHPQAKIYRKHLTDFKLKNKNLIDELQLTYKNNLDDLRLTNKKSRLEELSSMFATMKSNFNRTQNKESYKLLLNTLDQIRKEIEGEKLTLEGQIEINIKSEGGEKFLQDTDLTLFVIAKIAKNWGISVEQLFKTLDNTFYRKNVGSGNIEVKEIVYPSEMNYDFTLIVEKNRIEVNESLKQGKQTTPTEKIYLEKDDALKQAILKALKQRNE